MICRFNKITHTHCKYRLKIFKCCEIGLKNSSTAVALNYESIPSPKGLPIIGSTLSIIAAGAAPYLHEYVDKRHKQLGPIFKDRIGPVDAVFLSDPHHMRQVYAQEGKHPIHILPEAWIIYNNLYGRSRGLFFMDGEEWLQYRRIMNRQLLTGDLAWITEACKITSEELIDHWKVLNSKHEIVPNIEIDLYRWSLNTTIAVLLGKNDYQKVKSEINDQLEELAHVVHLIFETSSKFQILPASLAAKFNIPSWKRYVSAANNTMALASKLIETLLSKSLDGDGLLKKLQDEKLSKADITRIAIDLVLAAGDTTVYTMMWTLYAMAKNSSVQNDLRKSDKSENRLKNIIKESLRLYPVAVFLTRVSTKEAQVGGYSIPSGSVMLFSSYTHGRDPKYFADPEKFNPDRWSRETNSQNQIFMPFGFGARSCIGKKVAEQQLYALVRDVVQTFNLKLMNEKEIDIILKMVAVPSQSIKLKLDLI